MRDCITNIHGVLSKTDELDELLNAVKELNKNGKETRSEERRE